ncbi:MAG: hypothetical protein ACP5QI_00055 [Candidatus Bathyarchaeia archaeon]
MKTKKIFATAVSLSLLLLMHIGAAQSIGAETGPDIMARIDKGVEWLQTHRIVTTLGSYYSSGTGEGVTVDVAENSAVAYMFTMHTKLVPMRRNVPEILAILNFTLNAKTGAFFHPYFTMSGGWVSKPQPYYRSAEILQNLAFSSFHLRLEDQILTEDDKELLDEVVESSEDLIGELAKTYRTGDGAWRLKYEDGTLQARLKENSEILVSLLHVAAYEEEWGSPERSSLYGGYAQETARWILETQEKEPSRWGYGGFSQARGTNSQPMISNAAAVFSLTTYLRLISLLDEDPDPTIQEVREAIILWEEAFLKGMVDEHGGPYQERDEAGAREYPKELLAASLTLRAMAETWVVHGDPKYRIWCISLYNWITGKNEAENDLQLEDGSYLEGFTAPGTSGSAAGLYVNAYTTASLVYGAWINIPEVPPRTAQSLATLTLLLFASGFRLVNRVCPGRARTGRRSSRPQPMNPGSPYESCIGNP